MNKIYTFIMILLIIFSMTISAAVPSRDSFRAGRGKGNGFALMYHEISESSEEWSDYCVPPAKLENDIKALLDKGYVFIKSKDLNTLSDTTKKYAILTFDDGYESGYNYVYPLLEKYKVSAVFFITGSYVNCPKYLTSEQICEMSKSEFVEFGNHGYDIHNKSVKELKDLYADLGNISYIINDLKKTDDLLFSLTGKRAVSLSYPYGLYTSSIESNVKGNFNQIITFSTSYGRLSIPYIGIPVNRINRADSYDINNICR